MKLPATKGPATTPEQAADQRVRWRAGLLSLVVAVALFVVKYAAWQLTGSAAVLSDALESIVNVVAAAFGLGGLLFAGIPADRNHPYGHGKIEFMAAAFEGGLIAFAAGAVVYFEGLAVALSNVDEVIAIIKAAPTPPAAKAELMARTWRSALVEDMLARASAEQFRPENLPRDFGLAASGYRLSDVQAQRILEMQLQRLTNLRIKNANCNN